MPVSKKSATYELSHILTNQLIIVKAPCSQPVLQVGKQAVVAWSEIWAVRKVVKQFPAEMSQQYFSVSSCTQIWVVMEEHYTGCQHSMPFVLNGPT
jgi:hypothetical protein